jgi:uncharacterized membrane protein YdbT with pleckstrin-like domain
MKVYQSKIGLELIAPISMASSGLVVWYALNEQWVALALFVLVESFVIGTLFTTRYTIENASLKVKSGFIYNKTIDIKEITSITKTNTWLSAPAAALIGRIEIHFKTYDSVVISPKDLDEFVAHLQQINPAIKVTL